MKFMPRKDQHSPQPVTPFIISPLYYNASAHLSIRDRKGHNLKPKISAKITRQEKESASQTKSNE